MKSIAFFPLFLLMISLPKSFGQKIYEIYPAGGASGATYNMDAIVLQGPANQSLNGWSLQYASPASSFLNNRFNFGPTHSFNAQGYFYFETGALGSGVPLPFIANANFGFSLSNNGGKLALVNNQTALSGTCPLPNANIIDFVGYSGTSAANCAEGTPVAWNGSATNSMKRFQDTNNNSVDFVINLEPLPIELTDFKATLQKNDILLQWTTASEKNNHYFSVERSGNGLNFSELGQVSGFGNSSDRNNYTYTDENPLSGINYYRLKQVDTDGNFEYSPIRMIRFGKLNSIALYPNPTSAGGSSLLYLSTVEEVLSIAIIDGLGREISTQSISVNKGENQIPVSSTDLTSGIYGVKVKSEVGTQIIPMIVK
jgi:hypothetical protein